MNRMVIGLVGNYGSGKTELALNIARALAKAGRSVRLIDLDIVNPYFRSSEKQAEMEKRGVEVVAPVFANTTVDSPMLSPVVGGSFARAELDLILDVGGDPVGATALGQYRHKFQEAGGELFFVVNVFRPFTDTADKIISMLQSIEESCRMKVKGLINNSNLSYQTEQKHLIAGREMLREVSRETGLPVVMTAGLKEMVSGGEDWDGEVFPIARFMAPDFEGNNDA